MGEKMRGIVIEDYLLSITSVFNTIYFYLTILLLAITFLAKNKYKNEAYNLFYVLNTIVAWCSLYILLYWSIEIFIAWYGQNPYELHAFFEPSFPQNFFWIYCLLLMNIISGLLFFFKKLRINRYYTLYFLLISNIGLLYNLLTFSVWNKKDYLPSNWDKQEFFFDFSLILKCIIVLIWVLVAYYFSFKKNRLPFKSLFLK
jgi:hypothetical protein